MKIIAFIFLAKCEKMIAPLFQLLVRNNKKEKKQLRANGSKDFEKIRKNYIDTAKELYYNDSVIEKLSKAENDIQLENIMISARRG